MANKIDDLELWTWVQADIESCDLHFTESIEPRAIERLRRYLGDKNYYKERWPRLSERSSFVMTDVMDTILWIMPSLMRVFFGGNDVVSIEGRTPDDDPSAMRELVNWQVQRKNSGFMSFYRWFMGAMIFGFGPMKARWERKEKDVEETVPMTADQFLAFEAKAEGVKLLRAEEQQDGTWQVTIKRRKVVENYPIIEPVPISEFGFLPESFDMKSMPACYHKRLMSRSDIMEAVKKKEFKKPSDEALAAARYQHQQDQELDSYLKDFDELTGRDGAAGYDPSRELYWVHEVYGRYDLDGDGISEPMIVSVVGTEIVQKQENPLGRPPIAVISPYPDLYQLDGMSVDDMIGEIQDVKTLLVRQVIVNIANNNDRGAFVDEDAVNPDDLAENRKYKRFRNKDGRRAPDIIQYEPESPTSPMVMPFMDWIEGVKENRTGVTKYNQGLDSKSLNKTATGITAIMGAANQRIEMVARMFAETGVVDLFRLLVEMNAMFVDQEQVVRLTQGKYLQIRPDDLKGEFDLDIAAGIGAGQRQEATQNMMLLLSQIYPAMQAMGVPPTPENVHEAAKVLVEQMGYKDAMRFIPDLQALMQQQQMMAAMMPGMVPGAPGQPGPQPPAGDPQPMPGGQP
jgi:hypothetical protein